MALPTSAKAAGQKTSETTARLLLIEGGRQAWLEPISSKTDCDLVLSGQGDGKVLIDGSPVLTVEALTDVDALAEALSNITIVASPDLDGGSP